MTRRPRRKAEETREDILSMAETLFRRKGFSGITIADIAAALGMSPANVFKHFHSKAALADAITARHVSALVSQLECADTDLPARERLPRLVRQLMEAHLRDLQQNPYIFEMVLMTSGDDLTCGKRYKSMVESLFAGLVRQGNAEGCYHMRDPERAGRCMSAAFSSVLHPVFLVRYSPEELRQRCDELVEFVSGALTNPLDG